MVALQLISTPHHRDYYLARKNSTVMRKHLRSEKRRDPEGEFTSQRAVSCRLCFPYSD